MIGKIWKEKTKRQSWPSRNKKSILMDQEHQVVSETEVSGLLASSQAEGDTQEFVYKW